jgi:hypothetical protein
MHLGGDNEQPSCWSIKEAHMNIEDNLQGLAGKGRELADELPDDVKEKASDVLGRFDSPDDEDKPKEDGPA